MLAHRYRTTFCTKTPVQYHISASHSAGDNEGSVADNSAALHRTGPLSHKLSSLPKIFPSQQQSDHQWRGLQVRSRKHFSVHHFYNPRQTGSVPLASLHQDPRSERRARCLWRISRLSQQGHHRRVSVMMNWSGLLISTFCLQALRGTGGVSTGCL